MSCQQYQQIYQEFQDLKERYFKKMTELRKTTESLKTGKIYQELKNLKQQLQEKQKEMTPLLEKYFLLWRWEFSERIEGLRGYIRALLPISDHEILVAGGKGEVRILDTNTKEFVREITGFSDDICTILPISDHEILVKERWVAEGIARNEIRILQLQRELNLLDLDIDKE